MISMVKQDQTSKFHGKGLYLSFLSPTPSSTSQTRLIAVSRHITDFHILDNCGCLLSCGFQTTRMLAYNMQEYLGQVPHHAHSYSYPRCWGGSEESYYIFNVCMYLTICWYIRAKDFLHSLILHHAWIQDKENQIWVKGRDILMFWNSS